MQPRHYIRFGTIAMLATLVLAACAPNQVTAQEIMDRMQQARENLSTAHAVAEVSLAMNDGTSTLRVEGWTAKTDQTDDLGKPISKLRMNVLEASNPQNGQDMSGTEVVNDGETFWIYNPGENKVITGNISELQNGAVGAQDPTAQLMRMQQVLQQLIDGSDVVIESQSESVAGRDTWQIKLTPKADTAQQLQLASIVDTTLWVDKASDLPVKLLVDARDMGRIEATATTLDVNQPVDEALFTFTPPAGAEIINAAELAKQARPQSTTLEAARSTVDFALLAPDAVPQGTRLDDVQVLSMRGATVIQNYSGALTFSLVQSRGRVPGADQAPAGAQAQSVTVRGQQATLVTGGSGAEQGTLLRWQENGVTIVIAGTLDAAQAQAVAETLR